MAAHGKLYPVLYVHCTLYTLYRVLLMVYCIQYNILCKLYVLYCTCNVLTFSFCSSSRVRQGIKVFCLKNWKFRVQSFSPFCGVQQHVFTFQNCRPTTLVVNNRPGVVGAVLQTPLWYEYGPMGCQWTPLAQRISNWCHTWCLSEISKIRCFKGALLGPPKRGSRGPLTEGGQPILFLPLYCTRVFISRRDFS